MCQPAHYLGATCPDDPFDQSQEDLTIIFNLYRESGKQLKLSDWFGSYAVTASSLKEVPGEKTELLIRFLRAIASLQYLGYIKPAATKKDFVNKLIW